MRIYRIKNKYVYGRNRQNAKTYRPGKTRSTPIWHQCGPESDRETPRERFALYSQIQIDKQFVYGQIYCAI